MVQSATEDPCWMREHAIHRSIHRSPDGLKTQHRERRIIHQTIGQPIHQPHRHYPRTIGIYHHHNTSQCDHIKQHQDPSLQQRNPSGPPCRHFDSLLSGYDTSGSMHQGVNNALINLDALRRVQLLENTLMAENSTGLIAEEDGRSSLGGFKRPGQTNELCKNCPSTRDRTGP